MSVERTFPWRSLLFISVAINLFAGGAAIGAYSAGVRLERRSPEAVVDRMPGPRAFVASVPEAVRPQVRADLAQSWATSQEVRRAAAQARREAFQAAAAEPYDVERVRAAFARMRAADQDAVAVFHDNMAQAFATMTPEQRRTALASLARAAPARRQAAAPAEGGALQSDQAPGATLQGDGSRLEQIRRQRRQERRERLRERREGSAQP